MAVLFIFVHRQLGVFVIYVFPFVVGNDFSVDLFGRASVCHRLPVHVSGAGSVFAKLLARVVDLAEHGEEEDAHENQGNQKDNQYELDDEQGDGRPAA